MSIANYIPKHRRKAVSLMMHKAKAKLRVEREPDFETLRMRALQDARGQVLREGVSWTGDGLKPWRIVRSVHGRINQVDLIVGNWQRTGSMRDAEAAIKTGKWSRQPHRNQNLVTQRRTPLPAID